MACIGLVSSADTAEDAQFAPLRIPRSCKWASNHTDIGATAFIGVHNILNIYRRVVEPIEEQVRIGCAAHNRLENKDARTRLINVTDVKRVDSLGTIEFNIAQRRMTRTLDLNGGSRSAAGILQHCRKHDVARELPITVGGNHRRIGEYDCLRW